MMIGIACDALRKRKCLEVRYDGETRVVEVHAAGVKKDGTKAMYVWQLRNLAQIHIPAGWRLMDLQKITSGRLVDEISNAPRKDYRHNEAHIERFECQV
jgi:hypothetical protein